MEDLEALVTEQQDRCSTLAEQLQRKAEHVEAGDSSLQETCEACNASNTYNSKSWVSGEGVTCVCELVLD